MNIKLLPNYYLLMCWTTEERYGTIKDIKGRNITEKSKIGCTATLQVYFSQIS
jgi:hypothetical protein